MSAKKYIMKATVEHKGDDITVVLEGSGFEGRGQSTQISIAFDYAYRNLMARVSEAIFKEDGP